MKTKAIIPLAVGLAVGFVAIKYTMDTVRAAKGAPAASEEVEVVTARQDIPATSAIRPEMLAVTRTPRTPLLPRDGFAKAEELVGRVAQKSIPQGVLILPSMIAPDGTLPGLMVRVKEGFRAVAVKIDESSGVAYLVHPNDWVDVLVVMDVKKGTKQETVSRVILQRVQVGAVGQVLNDAPDEGSSNQAKTVTLIVREEDVPKLHLAQTRGRITLAMRGNDDAKIGEPVETSETEVFGLAEVDEPSQAADKGDGASKPTLVSTIMSGWLKSAVAAPRQPAAPPAPPPLPEHFTVSVINGSTDGSATDVQRITYWSGDSMEVVSVDKGDAPRDRHGSTGQPGAPRQGQPDTQSKELNEDERGPVAPSEVTER